MKSAEFREGDSVVDGQLTDDTNYEATFAASAELGLQRALKAKGVQYSVDAQRSNAILGTLLQVILPVVLIGGILIYVMNRSQGGGNRVMSFGKSKAKLISKDMPKTTFGDVAGVDEAVEELAGDQRLPRKSGEVPGHRRQDPARRASVRPAGNRQDAARPGGRRRGGGAVLLHLRLRLRRDVRRGRRGARA